MRGPLHTLLRQPMVQFVLLGTLLALSSHAWQRMHDRHVIDLSAAVKRQIAEDYRQQFGELPDAAKLAMLTQTYVRDEIFLREALALHLERNDEIVRRRLVQKFEFLQADGMPEEVPTRDVLARWFAARAARYQTPATITLKQVYFSPDVDGEPAAQRRAQAALQRLEAGGTGPATALGDAFPGPSEAGELSMSEARRIFGDSELSQRLFGLPVNVWSGPYRSGYGWHIVYVSARVPATLPSFDDVETRVLADYLVEQRRRSADRAFQALRAGYVIHEER